MSDVTLKAIEDLMDNVLDKKLDEKLAPIKATLKSHTESLEVLMSEKKNKEDGQNVTDHRLDRLENWGKKVGSTVGVNLEL